MEVLVALVVLSIGSGALWHHFRSSARLNRLNMERQLAVEAGRSEMEFVRILPQDLIRDTAYVISPLPGFHLMVARTVFDSARILETFDEVDVDENMRPLYLRRPLEIRVDIRKAESAYDDVPEYGERSIITLSFLKPQYVWY